MDKTGFRHLRDKVWSFTSTAAMYFSVFIRGFIAGICITAPVGPVGLLTIRRALLKGFRWGVVSGLGITAANTLYSAFSLLGVSFISDILLRYQPTFRTLGGLLLCFLGIRALQPPRTDRKRVNSEKGLFFAFSSTFTLALCHPLKLVGFTGIFAALGVTLEAASRSVPFYAVGGVLCGTIFWWCFVSGIASRTKARMAEKNLQKTATITGILILLAGIAFLISGRIM